MRKRLFEIIEVSDDNDILEKDKWIKKHIEQFKISKAENEARGIKPLTSDEIRKLADEALEYIPERVEHFAKIVGVDYGRITIRNQKTRWGSCSSKGNLNFNCLLMLTPPEAIDYAYKLKLNRGYIELSVNV